MRNFIPKQFLLNGENCFLDLEKNDIVYVRTTEGISQARILKIKTTINFGSRTHIINDITNIDFLLPNGDKFKNYGNGKSDIKFYVSYEDCRCERNPFIRANSTVHSLKISDLIIDKIKGTSKLKIKGDKFYSLFIFYKVTNQGINTMEVSDVIDTHCDAPVYFRAEDYLLTLDELRDYNIYPSYDDALEHYHPKLIMFED